MHLLQYNDIVGSFCKDFPRALSFSFDAQNLPPLSDGTVDGVYELPVFVSVPTVELYPQRSWTAIFCQSTRVRPARKCIIRSRSRMSRGYDPRREHVHLMEYVSSWIKQLSPAETLVTGSLSAPAEIFIFHVAFRSSQSARVNVQNSLSNPRQ